MSKKTVYPNTYTSTKGGKFQEFKNLKNVHTTSTKTYAETGLITGKNKSPNRPGTVKVSNFKCGLPTGAVVSKVTVYYTHSKVAYNNKYCNIPAPKISLMSGDTVIKFTGSGDKTTKVGKAPTEKAVKNKVSYTSAWKYTVFNDTNFSVRIDYPTNANNDGGYVRLYNVYVELEYKSPDFALKWAASPDNTGYNGDSYTVTCTLNNKNQTKYVPSVTITTPAGLTLMESSGNGVLELIQNRVYKWTPKSMSGSIDMTMKFDVNVTIPSGGSYPIEFTARDSLLGRNGTWNGVITPRPAKVDDDTSSSSPKNEVNKGLDGRPASKTEMVFLKEKDSSEAGAINNFIIQYDLSEMPVYPDDQEIYISGETTQAFRIYWEGIWKAVVELTYADLKTYGGLIETVIMGWTAGLHTLEIFTVVDDEEITLSQQYIEVIPETITTPSYTILQLSNEELDRLGDQTTYTVQTYMKEAITTKDWVSDWGHNYRIGVFNNAINENIRTITVPTDNDSEEEYEDIVIDPTDYDNLTGEEIYENAEYWSESLVNPNEYENMECQFPYNKNYPLYIIITGAYPEESPKAGKVYFTEPCIIEDDFYLGRESNGVYPIPIENTRKSIGDFAELNIESLSSATPIIFYDLPFDEDYGTNSNTAIRGIEVTGLIEQNTDDLNIYAKLKSSKGESRARSINLDMMDTNPNVDNRFTIGGMGDLWGLSTLDIVNMEDWEIEFMVENTINNNTGTINFSDVALTIYVAEIDLQNIQCKVNDEDLSYYGAFITDVEIPEGLKTDVKYLEIDGTDTNDPYRQNIREKTIKVELDVGNCELEGSTYSLRDIARLFVNKRDKYNRPIPNKIEFSHYPDIYWEYIMEKPFDNPVDITNYTNVKIELTVPSGTAFKKQATSTNRVGYVNGLANVSPVIVIKPTDTLMTITETLTDQNFHIGYPNDLSDKVLVIDCEDRIVWLKDDEDDEDGENITYAVDFNSDWFSIIEEYEFETTGCVIKDVSYIERW